MPHANVWAFFQSVLSLSVILLILLIQGYRPNELVPHQTTKYLKVSKHQNQYNSEPFTLTGSKDICILLGDEITPLFCREKGRDSGQNKKILGGKN